MNENLKDETDPAVLLEAYENCRAEREELILELRRQTERGDLLDKWLQERTQERDNLRLIFCKSHQPGGGIKLDACPCCVAVHSGEVRDKIWKAAHDYVYLSSRFEADNLYQKTLKEVVDETRRAD